MKNALNKIGSMKQPKAFLHFLEFLVLTYFNMRIENVICINFWYFILKQRENMTQNFKMCLEYMQFSNIYKIALKEQKKQKCRKDQISLTSRSIYTYMNSEINPNMFQKKGKIYIYSIEICCCINVFLHTKFKSNYLKNISLKN